MEATERGRAFLDTNVLVYLFDNGEQAKQRRAQSLLRELPASSLVVSAQVLGEFYWIATRKLPTPLGHDAALAAVDRFSRLAVVAIDRQLARGAIELAGSTSIAYWDALIVKAASFGACRRLLTEDLNHGQVIDGVRIENPFADAAQPQDDPRG